MDKIIKCLLTMTEIGMILYWIFATLVVLQVLDVSPELMYSDYQNPLIVSWNWSFFPIDILFAVLGLAATYGSMNMQRKRLLRIVSLALMFCAGLMAIAFWVLQGVFDLFWWAVNLWLIGVSSAEMGRIYRQL